MSTALAIAASPAISMQKGGKAPAQHVWKPAATPKGGTPWSVLEATREITRNDKDGYIYSKPVFTPQVKALAGKRITVAGWMQAIKPGRDPFRAARLSTGLPVSFPRPAQPVH